MAALGFKDIFLALIIGLFSFALQVWPRLKNRYFGIDTWRFALLADYIRRNKKLPDSLPEKYIVPGTSDNPPVLPLILSFLPKAWLDRNQGFISPFFDLLHSLTVFFLGYWITRNPLGGYIAQIIYGLTPAVPLEASNLSLRSLSSLVFTWTMVAVQYYAISPAPAHLLSAVFLIVLLAYTHRMSMQVLLFALIGFAVINKNPLYLLVFFLGVILAIVLFRGLYLRYLRGQLLLISFWMRNIQNRVAHQIRGNPSPEKRNTDFVRNVEYLIWRIPVLPFLAVNPWILYVCFGIASQANEGIWFLIMAEWSLILFALGIIFNFKPLRFLGEGQRYLEYGTSATAVVTSAIILKFCPATQLCPLVTTLSLGLGMVCLGAILFLQKRVVVNNPDKSITADLWSMIDFLNKEKEAVRIACIPHGLADSLAYFLKNGKVLLSDNSVGVWELQDFWPVVKRPLKEIADKYSLNFFLISTNYVALSELSIPFFGKVFKKGNYVLLQRTGR